MNKPLRRLLTGIFWIAVWGIAAAIVHLPLILPGPLDTMRAWVRLAQTAEFWRSTGVTLLRVAWGWAAAVLLGTALAAACHAVSWLDTLLSPVRSVIRATPVSSFILLVLLWMQRGRVPVFISFLMVMPIVWTGLQSALDAVDPDLIEMTRAYRFSRRMRLRYLYLPAVKPALLSGCMTGLGFAWKAGIAAEVIALPADSVGKHLYDAKIYLERADLFAWTLTVILLSMALEKALKAVLRRGKEERP